MVIQDIGNNVVAGSMHNLSLARAQYLTAQGGEIRTGVKASRIEVIGRQARSVRLSDGKFIPCRRLVAANVDPHQLVVDFLGEEVVGAEIIRQDKGL